MAAPNVVNVTTITARSNVNTVSTTLGNIVLNSLNSNQVHKINTVMVTNTNTIPISCNLCILRSSTLFYLASNIVVPVGTTVLLVAKDNAVYLEEGDALQTSAQAFGLYVAASYEVIS